MAIGGWSFKERSTAEKLKQLAERNGTGSTGKRGRPRQDISLEIGGWIFKMTEEITARSSITPGVGTCNPFFINEDLELEELKTGAGNSIAVEVYNMSETAIDYVAGKYILAKNVMGVPVVDVEFCE